MLDTWFSSALWPFSTLGWPEETPELKRYYPNAVLVTGFDIIFFWVARMMMMGLYVMKDVPFPTVYIHALVRDEKGQKMSKSKGNVMDPLDIIDGVTLDDLIEKRVAALAKKDDRKRIERDTKKDYPNGIEGYGADALRFTLAAMAAQGRDVKLSMARIEGYRNFATKLWNAARFGEMNGCLPAKAFKPKAAKQTVNRWIAGEVERTAAAVTEGIEQHRFNEAAGAIYHFVWHTFCDWYLELAKPILGGADEAAKAETQAMFAWALDTILIMLHPFKPFITEALWQSIGEARRARQHVDSGGLASAVGASGRSRRCGDGLGHRPDFRSPFSAFGDERAARGADPAADLRGVERRQDACRKAYRNAVAPCAAGLDRLRKGAPERRGTDRDEGRRAGAAAGRRDRSGGRERAAEAGN